MALYRRQRPEACRHGHLYTEENTVWIKSPRTFDGVTRNCRECRKAKLARRPRDEMAAKMRRWRAENPERNRRTYNENRRRKKAWLDSQKLKCSRCEEAHPACLEFHHRDPSQKDFLLSVAVAHYSIERLQIEVDKCDVLCSNCHRKLHWEERHKQPQEE